MASIKDVIDAFETAVNSSEYFQQFVADDLNTFNEDSKNSYPYLLLTPISKTDSNPRKEGYVKQYSIELYGSDLQHQGDGDERPTRYQKWEDIETGIKGLYTLLNSSVNIGTNPITYTYGYAQHNDDVVVVKAELTISISDC